MTSNELQARQSELVKQHEALDGRLALLVADQEILEEQRELVETWQEQLHGARARLDVPIQVAFLAQVGRGKSTLIAACAGLQLETGGTPQDWSVLPVGDGRTTLGETQVHLEERSDIRLRVEPWSADALEREVGYFAEDLWDATRGGGTIHSDSHEAAGEELYDLLRAWVEPEAQDRRARLRELAVGSVDRDALKQTLLDRVRVGERCKDWERVFADDPTGRSELQEVLRRLMDGELSDGPVPRVTHVHVPRRQGLEGISTIIDTQGLEPVATEMLIEARGDLQRMFASGDTLFVIGSEFESAPDGVSVELAKAITAGAIEPVVRLLVVDRRGRTSDARAQRSRQDRLEQCRERIRKAVPDLKLAPEHVLAVDARREAPELRGMLCAMADQARALRLDALASVIGEIEAAIRPLRAAEHAARTRELDLRLWWAWDAMIASAVVGSRDPLLALGGAIRLGKPWLQHWTHLHAAIRRRGRYSRLDLVELAASNTVARSFGGHARALAVLRTGLSLSMFGPLDDADRAFLALRLGRMEAVVAAHRARLHLDITDLVGRYFASPRAEELWWDCYRRWGQGPGYVEDIAKRFEVESVRARLRLVGVAISDVEQQFTVRPKLLRIKRIELANYRGVERAGHELTPVSVFAGDNGAGKTAWLEAIAAGLGALLPGMGAGEAPPLQESDVRQVVGVIGGLGDRQYQLPLEISVVGLLMGRTLRWSRSLEALPDEVAFDDEAVRHITSGIAEDVRAQRICELPVLAYYGTQRLWPVDLEPQPDMHVGTRFDGYRECLRAASTHQRMLTWMHDYTLVGLQEKRVIPQLQAIERAVVRCVPDAKSFEYHHLTRSLRLTLKDDRVIPFRLLSDGYRNMVAMVADIAWRASVLNPQLLARAPELVEGVVLIDEIDLHLHPRWQRHVLADLRRAFPRIQFICTTHSPFILQSLEPGQLVNLDAEASDAPYANESPEDIVEHVMGVPMPQRSRRREQAAAAAERYFALLERVPAADDAELAHLKSQLDDLLAPFSDNPAFAVYESFLKRKRAVALAGRG